MYLMLMRRKVIGWQLRNASFEMPNSRSLNENTTEEGEVDAAERNDLKMNEF